MRSGQLPRNDQGNIRDLQADLGEKLIEVQITRTSCQMCIEKVRLFAFTDEFQLF